MTLRYFAATAAAATLAAAGQAQAVTLVTLDFETDTAGAQAEGFTSTYTDLEFFSDLGAGLEVGDYGAQSDGQAMSSRNDTNGNFIKGVFLDGPHSFLSLDFGNDDAFYTNPGDRAVLTLYLGAAQVGQSWINLSPNDVMDQSLGFSFGSFDNFTFAFTNAAGSPFTGGGAAAVGLIEVIDNVTFDVEDIRTPGVPEPATWAMMIIGFGGVGAMARRRRMVAA